MMRSLRSEPLVSEARLYSCLVTRQTGRDVRSEIEVKLASEQRDVLTVLDFRNVTVIDFSCADEVVAKLTWLALQASSTAASAIDAEGVGASGLAMDRSAGRHHARFLLVLGLEEHHSDPIDSALRRRELAVAAERSNGEPALLGHVEEPEERLWHLVCRLGRVEARLAAERLGLVERETRTRLDRLYERRLLLRQANQYVSFRLALKESARRSSG